MSTQDVFKKHLRWTFCYTVCAYFFLSCLAVMEVTLLLQPLTLVYYLTYFSFLHMLLLLSSFFSFSMGTPKYNVFGILQKLGFTLQYNLFPLPCRTQRLQFVHLQYGDQCAYICRTDDQVTKDYGWTSCQTNDYNSSSNLA